MPHHPVVADAARALQPEGLAQLTPARGASVIILRLRRRACKTAIVLRQIFLRQILIRGLSNLRGESGKGSSNAAQARWIPPISGGSCAEWGFLFNVSAKPNSGSAFSSKGSLPCGPRFTCYLVWHSRMPVFGTTTPTTGAIRESGPTGRAEVTRVSVRYRRKKSLL
jgi:hypothetical protein